MNAPTKRSLTTLALPLLFLTACYVGGPSASTPSAGYGYSEGEAGPPGTATAPPKCMMQSNGQNVCGYNCRMGSDGRVACADTPNGRCAMGSDGHVTCSQLRHANPNAAAGPPPTCKMGSDGQQTCGYNCKLGSNGRFYCASRPDGRCALNSNGTFACP